MQTCPKHLNLYDTIYYTIFIFHTVYPARVQYAQMYYLSTLSIMVTAINLHTANLLPLQSISPYCHIWFSSIPGACFAACGACVSGNRGLAAEVAGGGGGAGAAAVVGEGAEGEQRRWPS